VWRREGLDAGRRIEGREAWGEAEEREGERRATIWTRDTRMERR
jgi:hypothetical protein